MERQVEGANRSRKVGGRGLQISQLQRCHDQRVTCTQPVSWRHSRGKGPGVGWAKAAGQEERAH